MLFGRMPRTDLPRVLKKGSFLLRSAPRLAAFAGRWRVAPARSSTSGLGGAILAVVGDSSRKSSQGPLREGPLALVIGDGIRFEVSLLPALYREICSPLSEPIIDGAIVTCRSDEGSSVVNACLQR